MTRFPGKNPNLTDEQVEDWLLRVQFKHPEQLDQERRDNERETLRLSIFPHHVTCRMDRIQADFPAKAKGDVTWLTKDLNGWMVATFGPECLDWQYKAVRGEPIDGTWVRVGWHFWFKEPEHAKALNERYGGKEWWE